MENKELTIQEIANYLEDNNYPMNDINDLSTDTMVLLTGLKGGYLFKAHLLSYTHYQFHEKDITKEDLDSYILAARKT